MSSGDAGSGARLRVRVVDAHPLRRAGFQRLLGDPAHGTPFAVVGAPVCGGPVAETADLALLSLGAARVEGPCVLAELRALVGATGAPVAVLSDHAATSSVVAALGAGARGYLTTSLDPVLLFQALRFIARGGAFFPPEALLPGPDEAPPATDADPREREPGGMTQRQAEVLGLLRHGRSNKQIARDLRMCESTVKVHVRQILRKLGAANRTQAALSGQIRVPAPMFPDAPAGVDEAPPARAARPAASVLRLVGVE